MKSTGIPLPQPTALSRIFWDGCRARALCYQRCTQCLKAIFIPMPCCPACASTDLEWKPSSGKGTVYSFSVVWRPQQPAFEPGYITAIVEMDEGWMMLTNIIDSDPSAVRIGMPVEVDFRDVSEQITLPYFRPSVPGTAAQPNEVEK